MELRGCNARFEIRELVRSIFHSVRNSFKYLEISASREEQQL